MDVKFTNQTREFLDNHPTLGKIEEFVGLQNQLKEISGLTEISFGKELDDNASTIKSLGKERETLSIELIRIKNQFLYCYRTFETKLNYLTKANIYALNEHNFLVFANNSRGLVEHAASICFQLKKANQCLTNLSKSKDFSQAMNFLKEYHDNLNKLFYGTRFFKQEGLVDAIGVLSLIDNYLAKEMKTIRQFYDFLCDFVHPNFGSNVLVTSGKLAEGVIDPPFEQKKEVVKEIIFGVGVVYEYLKEKSLNFSTIGMKLDNFIKKALDNNVSPDKILSISEKAYTGNGKTKETAIFFTQAVTPNDHVRLQYELLRKKFGVVDNDWKEQRIGGMENGFVYDVHVTTKGEIWFKLPMTAQ